MRTCIPAFLLSSFLAVAQSALSGTILQTAPGTYTVTVDGYPPIEGVTSITDVTSKLSGIQISPPYTVNYTPLNGATQTYTGQSLQELYDKYVKSTDPAAQSGSSTSSGGSSSSSGSESTSGSSSSSVSTSSGSNYKMSCFSANSTVVTTKGRMSMAEIYQSATENLQVMTAGGQFSPVSLWLHAEPQKSAEFLRLTTANGQSISLTRGHLVFKTDCDRLQRQSVRAGKISPGDCLMVDTDGHLQAQQVVKVDKFNSVGFYSPLTASGDLLVDNILASCYSEVEAAQLQSLMFDYVNMVKSAAKQLLSANIFSAIFGHTDNATPIAEAVGQFLGLSEKFIA